MNPSLFHLLMLILLLNAAVGLWRVLKGLTAADRMLAVELISTSSLALVLILGVLTASDALVDVALLFALLAAMAVANFATRAWSVLKRHQQSKKQPSHQPQADDHDH
ncbi:monovalent cation/H+ antiporter complex subunit F [Marinospirillum alkaliphilum]|uniref:Multisubunit sodium/proton antiporter, MrpF subunit n=1 Tax=Marinospirillum alkaliphilum DSM 21637 TaxID=1122209 RepID=A0A1K1ZZU9_9GAMM|nr:monovalent cation/H+ antiporter complex subunit F [Marinospirillum alkaliphilum]SFX79718.1 multisubunit sodium/proton antiporter, MrpF subunit [Marinospirillum alkaliphilum DSM 21637]